MPNIDADLERTTAEEAADPSLHSRFSTSHLSSGGVESFTALSADGILLNVMTKSKQWRKGSGMAAAMMKAMIHHRGTNIA
ncbi:hypothetical protein TMatcc_010314 [Talaromyces marneffei ATCC 18224]